MNIIVLGVGQVGATLIESFVKEGHNVVAVDFDESRVSFAVNRFDANGIVGGGLERKVLTDAGVENADFFIACTSMDETNILCCVLAKRLGAKRTIARVRDPQYYNEMSDIREFLGLDLAFNPEYRTAQDILNVLKFPSAISVESFAGGKAFLVEFEILKENPMNGKTLMEISASLGFRLLVCMVMRGDKVFIPKGDFTVRSDDKIFVIGTEQELTLFCKKFKFFKPHSKNVFIVGGGKIAYYLAVDLIKKGVSVKIMEKDAKRAEELSESLPSATVLLGDGTDLSVLKEEGFSDFDACVTATGMDEENIIISLFSKRNGVKSITVIDKLAIKDMVNSLGLDSVLSPRTSIASHIIKFIRSHSETDSADMNALYKLNENVEAIEFTLDDKFNGLNVPLSSLKIKKEVLIGGIVRGGEFILPVGDTRFEIGDRVIVVTTEKRITNPNGVLK